MVEQPNPVVKYCLYARKSSESDERQAMSIDSQIKEMTQLAEKEGLSIQDVRKESHSAKTSGTRAVFNQILSDLEDGIFNGVLTWAPDRLSRNAGDLGRLVDLMDLGKLTQIRTYSQTFTNTPSEKFLLMILCSQAKLENDNRALNVKRGIRAKCEMGWRPGMAPLGYINRSFAGVKDIVIDTEREPLIKEMFKRIGIYGQSGRQVKRWLDVVGFTTRKGKKAPLSLVYIMLKNSFYYGEFEYPLNGGNWYQGAHKPLISKKLFERVQKQLKVAPKSKWGGKNFAFKGLIRCTSCGASICGEERVRKLKSGGVNHHTYYHCTRQVDPTCKEPYVTEADLVAELVKLFSSLSWHHLEKNPQLDGSIGKFRAIRQEILLKENIDADKLELGDYARYIFKRGGIAEKRNLIKSLKSELYLGDRTLLLKPTTILLSK